MYNILAPLALLSILVSRSSAQLLDWLPVQDLPLTRTEIGGGPATPAASTMCMWDPDGDGPRPRCVVVAGGLDLTLSSHDLAFLDADGWNTVAAPSNAYSITAYTPPGSQIEKLYYATRDSIYRRDEAMWTRVSTLTNAHAMQVLDLDGTGPQPPKILIARANTVHSYDGTTELQIGGLVPNPLPGSLYCLMMWDADSSGPLEPRLLVAGNRGIYEWDGAQWTVFAQTSTGRVESICSFDPDGDGPNPPELIAVGDFATIGGVDTGRVAALRNGVWVSMNSLPYSGGPISRSLSFDPDGSGPMAPCLVVAGRFSQIGGIAAPNVAYYKQGSWNVFPQYWQAVSACIGINDQSAFSNSPQLMVTSLFGARPAFGIIALCDEEPGYRNDPAGGRRPQGETLSIGVIPSGDELSFQWFKENMPLVSGTTASGSVISGTASPRLTISGLTPQDEAEYHLAIGNAFGVVTTQPASISIGCAADMNADEIVNFPDYLDFITAFVNGDPVSDFNNDMVFDLFDYLDFVQAFSSPC